MSWLLFPLLILFFIYIFRNDGLMLDRHNYCSYSILLLMPESKRCRLTDSVDSDKDRCFYSDFLRMKLLGGDTTLLLQWQAR